MNGDHKENLMGGTNQRKIEIARAGRRIAESGVIKITSYEENAMKKRYKKTIQKGIGNLAPGDGNFQEFSEEIHLDGESVVRAERNVFGVLFCGCTITEPGQIKNCSVCSRSVCEGHSANCNGSIVCLSCCLAGGDPDPITCLSCSFRSLFRNAISGLIRGLR